jgi:2-phospho-L-lactate transferase/gluconeogenesis factor (CofD/UPF0052 family)
MDALPPSETNVLERVLDNEGDWDADDVRFAERMIEHATPQFLSQMLSSHRINKMVGNMRARSLNAAQIRALKEWATTPVEELEEERQAKAAFSFIQAVMMARTADRLGVSDETEDGEVIPF